MADITAEQRDVEQAWLHLNALQRALPDCEHVWAWREDVAAAHRDHRQKLAARDRAQRAATADAAARQAGTQI